MEVGLNTYNINKTEFLSDHSVKVKTRDFGLSDQGSIPTRSIEKMKEKFFHKFPDTPLVLS